MKKLLLLIGFLPLTAFAQTVNSSDSSPNRTAVTAFLSEALNYVYLEKFDDAFYQKWYQFYQTKYDKSDKNPLCTATIHALQHNLDFQKKLNFDKIKNELVSPSVATLSDEQVEQVLSDTKVSFFRHPSQDTEQLLALIKSKIGEVKTDGTTYDINDALKNCPAKN